MPTFVSYPLAYLPSSCLVLVQYVPRYDGQARRVTMSEHRSVGMQHSAKRMRAITACQNCRKYPSAFVGVLASLVKSDQFHRPQEALVW